PDNTQFFQASLNPHLQNYLIKVRNLCIKPAMTDANLNDLITPSEAAELREVSRQAIGDLIKRNKLQTWSIGKRVFVSRKAVLDYQPSVGGRPPKPKASKNKK